MVGEWHEMDVSSATDNFSGCPSKVSNGVFIDSYVVNNDLQKIPESRGNSRRME